MNENLKMAIASECRDLPLNQLSQASQELSARYQQVHQKQKAAKHLMATEAHRKAYVMARMPATYGVIKHVLFEMRLRRPDIVIKSLLDLGAGPGTGMWAAAEIYPELEKITLIEQDAELIAVGKRLAGHSEHSALRGAVWETGDLEKLSSLPPHDLAIVSYAINELSQACLENLLLASWQAASQALVMIEPGTPHGFELIRGMRNGLIRLGAHLVAPCPHALQCPMAGGDWCHFAERIERTSTHRQAKGGSLGYEDEKYSYVIGSKSLSATQQPHSRILRHPVKRSGHIHLVVCQAEGLSQRTISRRDGELYKQARKLEWGDAV